MYSNTTKSILINAYKHGGNIERTVATLKANGITISMDGIRSAFLKLTKGHSI